MQGHVRDVHGGRQNDLKLGADAPVWVYSTAPLAEADGRPVEAPRAGTAGHAMSLNDQQVGADLSTSLRVAWCCGLHCTAAQAGKGPGQRH